MLNRFAWQPNAVLGELCWPSIAEALTVRKAKFFVQMLKFDDERPVKRVLRILTMNVQGVAKPSLIGVRVIPQHYSTHIPGEPALLR